ncbi:hypothetical protein D9M72_387060 [compost metagenome]
MRGGGKSVKLLFFTAPFSISMANPGFVIASPNTQPPWIWASADNGLTTRLACTPAVTRCTRGSPFTSDTSTT